MTAPQEQPAPLSRETINEINSIRKSLSRNPNPLVKILDTQLRRFANGNNEDREALRPQIEKSISKIASSAGR